MARPTTRSALLDAAEQQFAKLAVLVEAMTEIEPNPALDDTPSPAKKGAHWERDKSLRDVLIHLYEWHQLLITWVEANQHGQPRPFLPAPYNWRNYAEMNNELWRMHQTTSCSQAWRLLQTSHGLVIGMAKGFTDEELFEKSHFAWTGTPALGSYFVSSTSSHYEWALKKLRRTARRID